MQFKISKQSRPTALFFAAGFLLLLGYVFFCRPPAHFPKEEMIVIPEGLTVDQAATLLYDHKVIVSPTSFSIFANLLFNQKIIAGAYVFDQPLGVFGVVFRVGAGEYNAPLMKLTFPEGMTVKEMAKLCTFLLPSCNEVEFLKITKDKEGYLFPDTYYFLPTAKAPEVVAALEENFTSRLQTLEPKIRAFGKPEKEIIIMASLLEGEGKTLEDRRIISGILWKRLSIGMPLQVDAVFSYIKGTTTPIVTLNDLKILSPYNTYTHTGLPPGPIGNPGLQSIEAAVTPIATPYLYYLSDKNNVFHYARTFAEHSKNKAEYLK